MRGSLVLRLTLLYGFLFLIFSVGIYFWATQTFSQFHLQYLDNHLLDEMRELKEEYEEDGPGELLEKFTEEAEARGKLNAFYRLITPDQKVLVSSDLSGWLQLSIPDQALKDLKPGEESWSSVQVPGRKTLVRVLTLKANNGNILQAGVDMGEGGRALVLFERVLLVSLAILLLLGSFAGGWIVHQAMRGVRRVTDTALEIGHHNLETRVPLENKGEEIDQLASAFNSMLNRIASLIRGLEEVSDNIAHDLKRPVARIRGIGEMILTHSQTQEETRESIGLIIEECDRLVGTVNTMLEIARLDAAGSKDPRQTVDLCALCRDAAELFGPAGEDRSLRFELDLPKGPVSIQGNAIQLQRALANLLDNTLHYAEAGTVRLSVQSEAKATRISVEDEGPGIPLKIQSQIFDRFFRGDPSRTQAGTGLGLSLVKAIVQAHGGHVDLQSEPGQGSRFILVFPKSTVSSSSKEVSS